jgi:hypothetical protein
MVNVMDGAQVEDVNASEFGPVTVQLIDATSGPGPMETSTVRDDPDPSGAMTGGARSRVYVAEDDAVLSAWSVTVTVRT